MFLIWQLRPCRCWWYKRDMTRYKPLSATWPGCCLLHMHWKSSVAALADGVTWVTQWHVISRHGPNYDSTTKHPRYTQLLSLPATQHGGPSQARGHGSSDGTWWLGIITKLSVKANLEIFAKIYVWFNDMIYVARCLYFNTNSKTSISCRR